MKERPRRRRVEAAEQLLDYEAPEEVVDEAKTFLTSIFEDDEMSVDIKLDALKLMRKAEAKKIVPAKATVRDDAAHVEIHRTIEIAKRKMALIEAGVWPPPPQGWADDLRGPDYLPMPTDDHAEPVQDIAEAVRGARLAAERKARAKSP
jgi:hypothetical protein